MLTGTVLLRLDEGQPTCARCQKSGFACDGYVGRNFIHFEPSAKYEGAQSSSETFFDVEEPYSSRNALVKHPAVPISLSLQPFREDIYLAFAHRYLLRGSDSHFTVLHTADLKIKGKTYTHFIAPYAASLKVEGTTQLTDASFSALATSFYGFKHGEASIMQEGRKRYGLALRDLNLALTTRSTKPSIDLLGSVVALSLFEVSVLGNSIPSDSTATAPASK